MGHAGLGWCMSRGGVCYVGWGDSVTGIKWVI